MALYLKKGDILGVGCDALIDPTDGRLSGSGGVDLRIHSAGGEEFNALCAAIAELPVGESAVTPACGELKARLVVHTHGPVYGEPGAEELLRKCYIGSLTAAWDKGCRSAAVPLISAGRFGFPVEPALCIARDAINEFLLTHPMTVYLMAYTDRVFSVALSLAARLRSFSEPDFRSESIAFPPPCRSAAPPEMAASTTVPVRTEALSLGDRLLKLDESFSEMLMRKIGEQGITNAECYTRALASKSVFSKIRNQPGYHPTKPTVAGFVIALRLPMGEAREMFEKAGYSLTRSSAFDVIVSWFIENGRYDVFELNEVLLEYDQPLIGF